MTSDEKILYDRLYGLSVSDLELLKEIADKVIFDKSMNGLMED